MEKNIKVELDSNLNINVHLGTKILKVIKPENREINALEIYNTLEIDYSSTYNLLPIQEQKDISKSHYDVLTSFYNLYNDILIEVNAIITENNTEI